MSRVRSYGARDNSPLASLGIVLTSTRAQIGGSLAKLVYFSREHGDDSLGGRLNFLKFETDRIDTCIDFMRNLISDHRDNGAAPSDICVMATGGGAYKYYDKITQALGVEVIREDEMESLITGKYHNRCE